MINVGSEWIRSRLPAHWSIARISDHVKLTNGYPFDSEYFTSGEGFPLVRIRDIGSDVTEVNYGGDWLDEASINTGDILIGMDGDFNIARWKGGRALLNQRVCRVSPKKSLDARYVAYALPNPLRMVNEFTFSTTVKHLSSEDILKIRIPLPPLTEQNAIADFLDQETTRIDVLIKAKERLLSLATEKHKSLIASSVTRGITRAARMRDSGVPWIGEIPQHWAVERTRWLFSERDERSTTGQEEMMTVSHLTGVTPRSAKDVNMFEAESTEGYKICQPGDLVINTLWAWMGAMGTAPSTGIVSPAYNVYTPNERLDPRYVDRIVRTALYAQEVTRFSKGVWSSRLRLYPEGFFETYMPIPPREEQADIVEHLAERERRHAAVRTATERSIELLRERRTALITAAVTGALPVGTAA